VSLWVDTKDVTVKVSIAIDNFEFGEASGTVRTNPGSELAEIFGGEVGQAAPGVSMFAATRWMHAVLTKTASR
jgi:hypothetical protein